jgi:hypothetical protein
MSATVTDGSEARMTDTPRTEVRPQHFVRCSRVPPGWRDCCDSCHEDEEQGWDTLYIENADIGPGVAVGVRYCCRGHDRVQRRIDRLTERLGGTGRRW